VLLPYAIAGLHGLVGCNVFAPKMQWVLQRMHVQSDSRQGACWLFHLMACILCVVQCYTVPELSYEFMTTVVLLLWFGHRLMLVYREAATRMGIFWSPAVAC
jgi:uncharacterized membrane protein